MPSNLLYMAIDSIRDGEPVDVVVDRVLRLTEQTSGGSSGGSSGATGGTGATGTGATGTNGGGYGASKGSGTHGKMNGKNHSGNKLMGKGVVLALHTAYRPDECSLKYPPSTHSKAYYKCRKRQDKTG